MRPKRKYPRIYDKIPVKLSTHRGGECFAVMITRQIGRGGCMIIGDYRMAPGSVLDVTLFVGGRCVSAMARVIYTFDHDGERMTGLEFLSMASDDQAAMSDYIGRKIEIVSGEEKGVMRELVAV